MQTTLVETDLKSLTLLQRGKVRDIYDLGDALLMVATDRISAFDYILPSPIPQKGSILTQISRFWMQRFQQLIPNHLLNQELASYILDRNELALLQGRAEIVRKAEPLPVEMIVRGYLAGSGFKEYQKTGMVSNVPLAPGLQMAEKLSEPIFTPSTKASEGQHDENISFKKMEELIGKTLAQQCRSICLQLYQEAAEYAETRGVIIADTKFELGLYQGQLLLIDEVLTPDSSRFWPREQYQMGISPLSFDKQFVRDYLLSTDWDRNSPPPHLPEQIVQKTAEKYQEVLKILTDSSI